MVSISTISSLGTVLTEDMTVDNNLFRIPRPSITSGGGTSSANTSVVNLMGKERRISLTGYFSGTSAQMITFVEDVMDWVNNGRQTAATYTGTFESSISVLCDSFNYSYSSENPNLLNWTMQLIQGSTLGFITGD